MLPKFVIRKVNDFYQVYDSEVNCFVAIKNQKGVLKVKRFKTRLAAENLMKDLELKELHRKFEGNKITSVLRGE